MVSTRRILSCEEIYCDYNNTDLTVKSQVYIPPFRVFKDNDLSSDTDEEEEPVRKSNRTKLVKGFA